LDLEVFFVKIFGKCGFGRKFSSKVEIVLTGSSLSRVIGLNCNVKELKVVVDVNLVKFHLVVYVIEFELLLIGELGQWIVVVCIHFFETVPSEPRYYVCFGLG
jgi:hypothetical protein